GADQGRSRHQRRPPAGAVGGLPARHAPAGTDGGHPPPPRRAGHDRGRLAARRAGARAGPPRRRRGRSEAPRAERGPSGPPRSRRPRTLNGYGLSEVISPGLVIPPVVPVPSKSPNLVTAPPVDGSLQPTAFISVT